MTYRDGSACRAIFAEDGWNFIEYKSRFYFYEHASPGDTYQKLKDYLAVLQAALTFPELKESTSASEKSGG